MPRVVHLIELTRPGGGPPGYLYNLATGLESIKDSPVIVISRSRIEDRSIIKKDSLLNRVVKKTTSTIGRMKDSRLFPSYIFWMLYCVFEYARWTIPYKPFSFNGIKSGDTIVVHNALDCSKSALYKGKVFKSIWLMPHGPVTFADELTSLFQEKFGNSIVKPWARLFINFLELRAMRRMDGLIIATETACESYFSDFPSLRKSFETLNFKALISGAPMPLVEKQNFIKVKDELSWCGKGPIISYVGRYHSDKGFKFFLQIAELIKEQMESVNICCAGYGALETEINNKIVRNLGWRKDIAEILAASDLVIVPNNHSYFDLVILESLSVGTPVLTTNIGGHRFYSSRDYGVKTFDIHNFNDALEQVQSILGNLEKEKLLAKRAYEEVFNLKSFAERHVELAYDLLKI